MEKRQRIGRIPLFEGLSEENLKLLSQIVREKSYERDETIFDEGDEADGLYVVEDGRVKIYKLSFEGKEQILHIFGAGEPFGEVAVFAGIKFPAYSQAMEKSKILIFPRRDLVDLIRRNPDLAMDILAVLSLRLRQFTHLIEDLSLKEVPTRLAAHLLYLSHQNDSRQLELEVTKGQLASLLGTIPETLSRILTRMKTNGLIEIDGRRIQLLDTDALNELAQGRARLNA